MTAGFAAGGAALPDSELPDFGGLAAFSAGFASSSAMMRRIDARISSIEGSWTFAGCVISDSTSSTSWLAFYTRRGRIGWLRICGGPTCPQFQRPVEARRANLKRRNAATSDPRANHFAPPSEGYVMATNDCKQWAVETAGRVRL